MTALVVRFEKILPTHETNSSHDYLIVCTCIDTPRFVSSRYVSQYVERYGPIDSSPRYSFT